MNRILRALGMFVLLACIFLVSGWIANESLIYTGSVWASSGIFGVSVMGLCALLAQAALYLSDVLHLF